MAFKSVEMCQVMGWVNQYHDTLRDLGIEEDELGFPAGSDRGIGMLTDKYIDRMRQQLNAWCTNILQVPTQQFVTHACLLPLRVRNGVALKVPAHLFWQSDLPGHPREMLKGALVL